MSRRKSQKGSRQIRDIEDQTLILKMEQRNRDLLFLRKMARPIVLAQRSPRIHVPSVALFRHPPHRSISSYTWIMGKAKDNRSILLGLPFPLGRRTSLGISVAISLLIILSLLPSFKGIWKVSIFWTHHDPKQSHPR